MLQLAKLVVLCTLWRCCRHTRPTCSSTWIRDKGYLLRWWRNCRGTTDLALRATKQTAAVISCSMVSLVVMEMHLWLNLLGTKEKDKHFSP